MLTLSEPTKMNLAKLVRLPLVNRLMLLGIRLVTPRQRIGVSLVALDEEKRVLLLRHVFHPHVPWGLPGGWLGRNEDPAQGVLRELKEETGLTAELGPVIQVSHDPDPPHITIAYLAFLKPGPMILSPEIIEADWFPLEQLPPLFPFMVTAIETAVRMHPANNVLGEYKHHEPN